MPSSFNMVSISKRGNDESIKIEIYESFRLKIF